MHKTATILFVVVACLAMSTAQTGPGAKAPVPNAPAPKVPAAQPDNSAFKNQKDKVSYAIGLNVGKALKRDTIEADPNLILQGIKDALADKSQMTDEEIRSTMMQLQQDVKARDEEKRKADAEINKKAGDEFLAANKSKEGVVVLPDGLQYKILNNGTGPKPTAADTVVFNYRGTLINGTEFDSSYKRNQPVTYAVARLIKGWTEALQMMPVGSKWQLFIPPSLAYGEAGSGPNGPIGPDETLIFEVELVAIQKATSQAAPEAPKPDK